MNPPGSANAFTVASSTTLKLQGRLGRSLAFARRVPSCATYRWTFSSGYRPYEATACWSASFPVASSCARLTSMSCFLPVAGLVAQAAAMAAMTAGVSFEVRGKGPPRWTVDRLSHRSGGRAGHGRETAATRLGRIGTTTALHCFTVVGQYPERDFATDSTFVPLTLCI